MRCLKAFQVPALAALRLRRPCFKRPHKQSCDLCRMLQRRERTPFVASRFHAPAARGVRRKHFSYLGATRELF